MLDKSRFFGNLYCHIVTAWGDKIYINLLIKTILVHHASWRIHGRMMSGLDAKGTVRRN